MGFRGTLDSTFFVYGIWDWLQNCHGIRVVGNQGYGLRFSYRSRDVIYDVTGISGMSNDVREECLECHMKSHECLECYMTSEKNVWNVT